MSFAGDLRSVGETVNTRYWAADADILVVDPNPGTVDDPELARINVDFQNGFARKAGRRVGLVVIMGNLLSQDADTRRVYAQGLSPDHFFGAALVVSNPLSRAIGSFFLGLSRPAISTGLFDSVEAAVDWLRGRRGE